MSASNWARCPRCTIRGQLKLRERDAEIQASYGKVPVVEFDEARRALAADTAAFEKRRPTFREDYEIYGAETGSIRVSYGGSCEECGLSLEFDHSHIIPDWNKP